ncbi:MAG: cytochrome c [Hyphomicrobiaceae bacterium]
MASAVASLALIVSFSPAGAADLAMEGSAIAAARCGKCHSVGVADDSPHQITPPFRTLGERYPIDMLVEALKTGSISGHDEMPQFDLGPDGIRALVAYIDSLNPKGPHYLDLGQKP